MRQTSELYRELFAAYLNGAANVKIETSLATGGIGVLVDELDNAITFGGYRILVAADEAGAGHRESVLISMKTNAQL